MIDEQAPSPVAQPTERPIGAADDADFPGSINVGGGFFEGHYPGNKLVAFVESGNGNDLTIAAQVNEFFEKNPGCVVTGMWFDGQGAAYVLFTRLMSREEADSIQKFAAEVKAKMNLEKAKKLELEAEKEKRAAEVSAKMAEDTKKYVELGKRCEANHKKDKA